MGREIKRVPFNFAWPLKKVWIGYVNPHYEFRYDCKACDGTGREAEGVQVSKDFYNFGDESRCWCDKITQDEVDALVENNRLWEWTKKGIHPTANEVNEADRHYPVHDAINRMILVETRCKRLGVDGKCPICHGEGELWYSEVGKAAYEAWENIEPPEGEGYQVWENVSEGSPISPVFKSVEELIGWLIGEGYSREAATNFARSGSAMTMVYDGETGEFYKDIEACALE